MLTRHVEQIVTIPSPMVGDLLNQAATCPAMATALSSVVAAAD